MESAESTSPAEAAAVPIPKGSDNGRSCAIATLITVGIWLAAGAILAVYGVPPGKKPSEPAFMACVTLLGFGFCAGQGAAVTGFIAMKQRQNPLWIVPAIVGALLGVAAMFAIVAMAMIASLREQGFDV